MPSGASASRDSRASVAEEITRGKIAVLVEYLKSIQRKD
jgi:hypothetical protein